MRKLATGIAGLDKMLNGGVIEGRPYLVVGGPGSGKTIFCVQFLMEGLKKGEKCLYVTLEEPAEELRENMALFGWDISKVPILDLSPEGTGSSSELHALTYLGGELEKALETVKPSRVVFDSTTTIKLLEGSEVDGRRRILSLMKLLANSDCTSILICEGKENEQVMEAFLARGVIRLHSSATSGEIVRAIGIEKMRGTAFDEHIRPIEITKEGIVVHHDETAFERFS